MRQALGFEARAYQAQYWADGLAKECGCSIQFSGMHHALHNE